MSDFTAVVEMAVQGKLYDEKDAEYQSARAIRGEFVGAPDAAAVLVERDAAKAAYLAALGERIAQPVAP